MSTETESQKRTPYRLKYGRNDMFVLNIAVNHDPEETGINIEAEWDRFCQLGELERCAFRPTFEDFQTYLWSELGLTAESTPSPPLPGMTKIPYGLPLMTDAWLSCIQTAIGDEEVRHQFKQETGHDLSALVNTDPIGKLIDKSTGHTNAVMAAWCDWATANIWGEEEQLANESQN